VSANDERIFQVLHSRGDDAAVGRAHAERFPDGVRKGMVSLYVGLWRRLLDADAGIVAGPVAKAVERLVDAVVLKPLTESIPDRYRRRIAAVADASRTPERDLLLASVLPDVLPIAQGALARWLPQRFVERRAPELGSPAPIAFGCSSALLAGDKGLVGRNLDFPGVGYWDRYPVLQSFEIPGKLRYVAVTSAGIPFAGITGVNEAGLYVALHQHYSRDFRRRGIAPFFLAEDVLGECRSVAEAIEAVSRGPVASAWAFLLADAQGHRAIVERSPKTVGPRRADALLTHSNFFQSDACRPHEYATSERMNWDNWYRNERLRKRLAGLAPATVADVAAAMSDHVDDFWGEEKPVNRIVAQLYNIQSVVYDPSTRSLWLAEGETPIHLGRYRRYDLGEIFSGREGRTEEFVSSYRFANPCVARSRVHYSAAFVEGFEGRWDRSADALECAQKECFTAEGALVLAILRMKQRRFAEALDRVREGLEHIEKRRGCRAYPPEYFELRLYEGRALDLLGRNKEAAACYRALAKCPDLTDRNLRAIARRARPFTVEAADRLFAPFSSYVPFR
jgi:hypothetical protein